MHRYLLPLILVLLAASAAPGADFVDNEDGTWTLNLGSVTLTDAEKAEFKLSKRQYRKRARAASNQALEDSVFIQRLLFGGRVGRNTERGLINKLWDHYGQRALPRADQTAVRASARAARRAAALSAPLPTLPAPRPGR